MSKSPDMVNLDDVITAGLLAAGVRSEDLDKAAAAFYAAFAAMMLDICKHNDIELEDLAAASTLVRVQKPATNTIQ